MENEHNNFTVFVLHVVYAYIFTYTLVFRINYSKFLENMKSMYK